MASSTTYNISCRDYKLLIFSIKRPKSPRPFNLWCLFANTVFTFLLFPSYINAFLSVLRLSSHRVITRADCNLLIWLLAEMRNIIVLRPMSRLPLSISSTNQLSNIVSETRGGVGGWYAAHPTLGPRTVAGGPGVWIASSLTKRRHALASHPECSGHVSTLEFTTRCRVPTEATVSESARSRRSLVRCRPPLGARVRQQLHAATLHIRAM